MATKGPGVYKATYSNTPVWELQFGPDLKEHVMRRCEDSWINATHILKAAGFDKPARTRILEREVQKDRHEKIQGGYGKFQGTWIPLEAGEALARRNGMYEKLRLIFEFVPGDGSPPPAPKHATNKPKPKKPAVPRFNASQNRMSEDYDNMSEDFNDAGTPEDTTVASESFLGDEERFDISQQSTGHRKRKRDDATLSLIEQNHLIYADELLDYFLLAQADEIVSRPEPPPNFQADRPIDSEGHAPMHWACSMGDLDVMKQLQRFGADIACRNVRGETPLMRAVLFTNCQDKQTMPQVAQQLITTIDAVDYCQSTAIHHAAALTSSKSKHHCARYYLEVILNKLSESRDQSDINRILDMQDVNGNTACHIAAKNQARKCVKTLIGRGASTDIPNNEGITAEYLIQELNRQQKERAIQASSSPFAPDSSRKISFQEPTANNIVRSTASHHSEAAMSVESKVTPLILDKFRDLAKSFDEELVDRDHSEKEAKRILNGTNYELASTQEQIHHLGAADEDEEAVVREQSQLIMTKQTVTSLVEQQQQLRLASRVMHEDAMANGHMDNESVELKLELYARLEEQQSKRVKLVNDYTDALSMAGAGGKVELYRQLINKCLNFKGDEIDGQLDSLIGELEENAIEMNGLREPVQIE